MHPSFRHAGVAGLLAGAFSVAACNDVSPLQSSTELDAGSVRYGIVAGDQQSAPAGSELPLPLVVRVTSATGAAIPGQIVNWVVTEGGGSVFAGTAVTDSLGFAREWWTLGDAPGPNALEVRAVDTATGEALVFGRFLATGTDTTVAEPEVPAPSVISISGIGYKRKGLQRTDLEWSGAVGTSIEIHRDGRLLVTTANDGAHLDAIDRRGGGIYRYRVCEVGATACSAELQIGF